MYGIYTTNPLITYAWVAYETSSLVNELKYENFKTNDSIFIFTLYTVPQTTYGRISNGRVYFILHFWWRLNGNKCACGFYKYIS